MHSGAANHADLRKQSLQMTSTNFDLLVTQRLFYAEKKWKTAILKIYFLHFTSEFQTPVPSYSIDENIKCGYSFSLLDRKEHFVTTIIVRFLTFSILYLEFLLLGWKEDTLCNIITNGIQRQRMHMKSCVMSCVT